MLEELTVLFQQQWEWFNAVYNANMQTLSSLIGHGANVNMMMEDMYMSQKQIFALMNASWQEEFLEGEFDESKMTMSALSIAADLGRDDVIHFLLKCGAKPLLPDQKSTPLSLAVVKGHIEFVSLFLEYGIPKSGNNPIQLAADYGHVDILEMLIRHEENSGCLQNDTYNLNKALLRACVNKNIKCVKILLESGADPNTDAKVKLCHGPYCSPVSIAAGTCDTELMKLLLSYGGSIHSLSFSPVCETVQSLWPRIFDCNNDLFQKNTNFHPLFQNNKRIVQQCTDAEVLAMLVLLQHHGADVNKGHSMYQHRLPLHLATRYGCIKTVQNLIDLGAQINLRVQNDGTHRSLRQTLLQTTDHMFTFHQEGMLPICHAICFSNESSVLKMIDIFKLLIQEGHLLHMNQVEDNPVLVAYILPFWHSHIERLVQILLYAGVQPHTLLSSVRIFGHQFDSHRSELEHLAKEPKQLKLLARDTIRESISAPLVKNINQLTLPHQILGILRMDGLSGL